MQYIEETIYIKTTTNTRIVKLPRRQADTDKFNLAYRTIDLIPTARAKESVACHIIYELYTGKSSLHSHMENLRS